MFFPPDCFMICVQILHQSTAVKTNPIASGEKTLKANIIGSQKCSLLPECVLWGFRGCNIKNWSLTVMIWEQSFLHRCQGELQHMLFLFLERFLSPQLMPNCPSALSRSVVFLGNLSWLPVSKSLYCLRMFLT